MSKSDLIHTINGYKAGYDERLAHIAELNVEIVYLRDERDELNTRLGGAETANEHLRNARDKSEHIIETLLEKFAILEKTASVQRETIEIQKSTINTLKAINEYEKAIRNIK